MRFKSHNFEAWLSQVNKELSPGVNPDDLIIHEKYFTHSGFSYPNAEQGLSGLIASNVFTGIADVSGLEKSDIEKILNLGVETLYIKFTEDYFPDLSFIDFKYVHPIFDVIALQENKSTVFYQSLKEKYQEELLHSFIIVNDKNKPSEFYKLAFDEDNLPSKFKQLIEAIESGTNSIWLEYNTGINFNSNIATLRAIRIVMENIKVALSKPTLNYKISVSPKNDLIDPLTDESIIRLNYFAIGSIIGSVDYLHLIPFAQDYEKARIANNMLNVFKHESFMDLYNDSVSGSYFFEDITNQTAHNIWQALV